MNRSRRARVLLLAAAALTLLTGREAAAQFTAPYSASWIMISGSATLGDDLILEVRDADGSTVIDTSPTITVGAGNSTAVLRNAIEAAWVDDDGDSDIFLVPNAMDPSKIDVYDDSDRSFRIYLKSVSGSFSELTDGGPVVIDGASYLRIGVVETGVPTVTEWGLLALMLLLVASGVWMMRRQRGGLAMG
jgi:hypothetical protein